MLFGWTQDIDDTDDTDDPELTLGKDAEPIEKQLASGQWRVAALEKQLVATKARLSTEEEERDRIEAELRSLRDE